MLHGFQKKIDGFLSDTKSDSTEKIRSGLNISLILPGRGEVFALGRIGEIVTYIREALSLANFSPV